MKLTISKEGEFIPAFNGNKELPVTDQIRVQYRTPTLAMKNRCRTKPQAKGIAGADGKMEKMEIVIDKDEHATLREMLIRIDNCSFSDGSSEQKIATAQNLIDAPVIFEPLLKEIVKEFDRILDEATLNEKN
jgi:hypothetical protein